MNDTRPPRHTLGGIGAVVAGLVAIFVLSLGTDAVLHATGVFPLWGQPMSDSLFLLAPRIASSTASPAATSPRGWRQRAGAPCGTPWRLGSWALS